MVPADAATFGMAGNTGMSNILPYMPPVHQCWLNIGPVPETLGSWHQMLLFCIPMENAVFIRFLQAHILCWPGLLAIWLGMFTPPAWALTPVTLQLKWSHAFQFAGYYAAHSQGYYRDAGLAVTIRSAQPGDDPLKQVLAGQAEFGVGTSSLLLARKRGEPVVVLAVIFQHSPLVLLSKAHDANQGIHDLVGKRVMLEPQSDELLAYLQQEGISPRRITWLAHSYHPAALQSPQVDAVSAYSTNEPYYLDQAGVAYHTYTPRAAGIDFYGDNLFTREAMLRDHPDVVRAFRAASLRGWQYAMAHPEEIIQLIRRDYASQQPVAQLRYEAQRMLALLRPDLIEVGYMHVGRWRHIANTYADLGLLPRDFSLKGFLYDPNPQLDLSWVYAGMALLALVSGIALYTHRINRRLDRALKASQDAVLAQQASEERLRQLAQYDWLTELPNRILFVERLQLALDQAQAASRQLAVLFIDLDGFKPVNDSFGHALGDALLKTLAQRMRANLHADSTLARIGGDEFVVLLTRRDHAGHARQQAEQLCACLRQPVQLDGKTLQVSASIGIAWYPEHGGDALSLIQHADLAMYQAKRAGRNQVAVFSVAALASSDKFRTN